MTARPIRVLVADDHTIVRTGIRHVLESEPGFEVVGEAATGSEALSLSESLHPDVIVLDISMPGESGLQVAARLRDRSPEPRILILSMHDNPEYVMESVRAGAHGYLLKDTAATELRGAISTLCRGEAYFSPPIASRLREALRGEHANQAALAQLTGREREVLSGVAQGRTNKEIAAELGISHRTVETHRESLMRKLQIRTVAELTRFALGAGIIEE
ncbi:MAG TPA: response regulator transcription factor [Gemmatimonadales bacterium]|nr:response regulator transcription factor [Gemmatimonadales bacterium]